MERKNYNVGVNSQTPQTVQFTAAYHAEHNAWRRRRGQWQTLCRLIRTEAPKAEIYAAASEAGAAIDEVWDMMTLSRRARDSKAEAAKLDGAEKQLAAAQKRLAAAEKMLNKAGLSVNDQDAAREEYEAAFFAHDRAKMDVIGPRSAVATVALAKSENLL